MYRADRHQHRHNGSRRVNHNPRRNACGIFLVWREQGWQFDLCRTSPDEDSPVSANESRQSSQDASSNVRDPFALQSHPKNSNRPLPAPSASATANMDRNWQSYVQQQYQHLSSSFGSRPPRSNNPPSGSITQGSPISPSARPTTDSQQYPSASNNQLVNPRYSYYMNKSTARVPPWRTWSIRRSRWPATFAIRTTAPGLLTQRKIRPKITTGNCAKMRMRQFSISPIDAHVSSLDAAITVGSPSRIITIEQRWSCIESQKSTYQSFAW